MHIIKYLMWINGSPVLLERMLLNKEPWMLRQMIFKIYIDSVPQTNISNSQASANNNSMERGRWINHRNRSFKKTGDQNA
jgi:hypothetical protein